MSTVFYHRRYHALVVFDGKLTWESALDLVETLDTVIERYFYDAVELIVTSPGGDTDALWHVLVALRERQTRGVTFQTRVVSYAASSAAVLACAGDLRSAAQGARYLFHQVRVRGDEALTARAARTALDQVSRVDRSLLDEMVDGALLTRSGVPREPSAAPADRAVLDALWPVVASGAGRRRRPRAVEVLARVVGAYVERAVAAEDGAALLRLYRRMLGVESYISAGLARTLRLIDWVGAAPDPARASHDAVGLTVPEWRGLYPPDGTVPRAVLARHMLVLGETGSGKTCSAVLPLLAALACCDRATVSATLVVDPKRELGPVLAALSPARLRPLSARTLALNLMAGARWSVEEHLAAGRWLAASHRMLVRAASFVPTSAARVLLPHEATHDASGEFFDREGTALARCVLALVLALLARGPDADAELLGDSAERAEAPAPAPPGIVFTVAGEGPRSADASGSATELSPTARLKRWLARFRSRAASGLNALALTHWALTSALVSERACRRWLFSHAVEALGATPGDGDEDEELREQVVGYFEPMSNVGAQHAGVLSSAVNACVDFAAPSPARALFFGCEPGYLDSPHRLDLARAVSPRTAAGTVMLVQPARDDLDHLVAVALKAALFEAVLDDPDRARGGADLPLVAYVADEAHRFVTSDLTHGEQSYLDTCRAYGGVCVLASQAVASISHALAHGASRSGVRDTAVVDDLEQRGDEARVPLLRCGHHRAHRRAVSAPVGPGQRRAGPSDFHTRGRGVLRRARRRAVRAVSARAVRRAQCRAGAGADRRAARPGARSRTPGLRGAGRGRRVRGPMMGRPRRDSGSAVRCRIPSTADAVAACRPVSRAARLRTRGAHKAAAPCARARRGALPVRGEHHRADHDPRTSSGEQGETVNRVLHRWPERSNHRPRGEHAWARPRHRGSARALRYARVRTRPGP